MRKLRPKTDRRLLGTWRSDRRRTVKEWRFLPRTPQRIRKRLAAIFGHLALRYTRRRLYSDYRGDRQTHEYEVLASDAESVAIIYRDLSEREWKILHIHFEGRWYWISLGPQREFFRRVTKPAR